MSNPAPTETTTATGFILHKELNAFANYGAADGAADIVYTGQVGAWTFTIPAANIVSATVVASLVADDHASEPIAEYSYVVWSGTCDQGIGPQLPHGSPFNSRFTNWMSVTYAASLTSGGAYTVSIENTSTTGSTGDWIGVDWIELHVQTQ